MDRLIRSLLIFAFLFLGARSAVALSGNWIFTEMIFRGVRQPMINPALKLVWTFFENGTERLSWSHDDRPGFCERISNYEIKNGQLFEEVFAVNPRNSRECDLDQDMHVGTKTQNKIEIFPQEILLHVDLGDDDLIYVLRPLI